MNKKSAESLFKELAKNSKKPEIARLRDIYDDVEGAIKAGVPIAAVFNGTLELGFTMTESSFKNALHRIRKERGLSKQRKKKVDKQHPQHLTSPVEQKPSSEKSSIINSALNPPASMPAELKPAAPTPVAVPTRKLLCGPIPEDTPLMVPLANTVPEFSQEGDLEHTAISGLILNRIQRMTTITLEYTDENGEVFSETPHEKRFRLTWRKPIPTTPSATSANFTKMDMSIFGNQSG